MYFKSEDRLCKTQRRYLILGLGIFKFTSDNADARNWVKGSSKTRDPEEKKKTNEKALRINLFLNRTLQYTLVCRKQQRREWHIKQSADPAPRSLN